MKIRPSGWLEEEHEADDASPVAEAEEAPSELREDRGTAHASADGPYDEETQVLGSGVHADSDFPPITEQAWAEDDADLPAGDPLFDGEPDERPINQDVPSPPEEPDAHLMSHSPHQDVEEELSSAAMVARPDSSQPYEAFADATTPVHTADPDVVREGLLKIIAVEGPVLGERLKRVYVESSGLRRMGHVMDNILTSALEAMVRRKLVIADDPLKQRSADTKTYRLPGQPVTVLREAGPREIRMVPPRETAWRMAGIAHDDPSLSRDALLRATLESYGGKRLTELVRAHLNDVYRLMQSLQRGESG